MVKHAFQIYDDNSNKNILLELDKRNKSIQDLENQITKLEEAI